MLWNSQGCHGWNTTPCYFISSNCAIKLKGGQLSVASVVEGGYITKHLQSHIYVNRSLRILLQVFRVSWWAAHYGARSSKPHYGFSNSPVVRRLDRGILHEHQKVDPAMKVETTVHYTSKDGTKRFKGSPALKGTEMLDARILLLFSGSLI